jgi:hypothetical protein
LGHRHQPGRRAPEGHGRRASSRSWRRRSSSRSDAKIKVETQINGDKLRITGKKRDDLQAVMALLKAGEFERPLQYDNFRD